MIKSLITGILIVVFWAPFASAVIDPDPDQIGIYFDPYANTIGDDKTPNVPFFVYVILTNPSRENISGAAFQYRLVVPAGLEGSVVRLREIRNPEDVTCIVGCDPTDTLEGYHVLAFDPALPRASAIVLLKWEFMLIHYVPIEIYLGPIDPAIFGDQSPSYNSDGGTVVLGSALGTFDVPLGYINLPIPLPLENLSFGKVKTLFR